MNDTTQNSNAPAQTVEPQTIPLVGKHFAHFGAMNPLTNRRDVRMGIVAARLDDSHWELEFHASNFRFSNIFSTADLKHFVLFVSRDELDSFMTDLAAQQILAAQPPKTNAGRGRLGTKLEN